MLAESLTLRQAQPPDFETVLDILEEATRWISSKGIEHRKKVRSARLYGRESGFVRIL